MDARTQRDRAGRRDCHRSRTGVADVLEGQTIGVRAIIDDDGTAGLEANDAQVAVASSVESQRTGVLHRNGAGDHTVLGSRTNRHRRRADHGDILTVDDGNRATKDVGRIIQRDYTGSKQAVRRELRGARDRELAGAGDVTSGALSLQDACRRGSEIDRVILGDRERTGTNRAADCSSSDRWGRTETTGRNTEGGVSTQGVEAHVTDNGNISSNRGEFGVVCRDGRACRGSSAHRSNGTERKVTRNLDDVGRSRTQSYATRSDRGNGRDGTVHDRGREGWSGRRRGNDRSRNKPCTSRGRGRRNSTGREDRRDDGSSSRGGGSWGSDPRYKGAEVAGATVGHRQPGNLSRSIRDDITRRCGARDRRNSGGGDVRQRAGGHP